MLTDKQHAALLEALGREGGVNTNDATQRPVSPDPQAGILHDIDERTIGMARKLAAQMQQIFTRLERIEQKLDIMYQRWRSAETVGRARG